MYGIKLLVHSHTSMVRPLKFGNGQVITPTLYYTRDYLSMLGLKLNHVCKRGPRTSMKHGIDSLDSASSQVRSRQTMALTNNNHTLNIYIGSTRVQWVNSSPLSATYMRQWTGSARVHVMVCHLFRTKPLPEPILIYCQGDPWKQTSGEIWIKILFHSRKCIWTCCLRNGGCCPGGDELKASNPDLHLWIICLLISYDSPDCDQLGNLFQISTTTHI